MLLAIIHFPLHFLIVTGGLQLPCLNGCHCPPCSEWIPSPTRLNQEAEWAPCQVSKFCKGLVINRSFDPDVLEQGCIKKLLKIGTQCLELQPPGISWFPDKILGRLWQKSYQFDQSLYGICQIQILQSVIGWISCFVIQARLSSGLWNVCSLNSGYLSFAFNAVKTNTFSKGHDDLPRHTSRKCVCLSLSLKAVIHSCRPVESHIPICGCVFAFAWEKEKSVVIIAWEKTAGVKAGL